MFIDSEESKLLASIREAEAGLREMKRRLAEIRQQQRDAINAELYEQTAAIKEQHDQAFRDLQVARELEWRATQRKR